MLKTEQWKPKMFCLAVLLSGKQSQHHTLTPGHKTLLFLDHDGNCSQAASQLPLLLRGGTWGNEQDTGQKLQVTEEGQV